LSPDRLERPGKGAGFSADKVPTKKNVDAETMTDMEKGYPNAMDFLYDVAGLLVEGAEVVGEDDIIEACAEKMEVALQSWKDLFRVAGRAGAKLAEDVIIFVDLGPYESSYVVNGETAAGT